MPLVKVSMEQLEAAQELYNAAVAFINSKEKAMDAHWYYELVAAVDRCKEEYEKHG